MSDGLLVLDTPEDVGGRQHAFEMYDVRTLVLPPRRMPLGDEDLDPRLDEYLTGLEKDLLTPDALATFVHREFGGDSWDEDPAFALRMTQLGVLEVRQSLTVLKQLRQALHEIETVVER